MENIDEVHLSSDSEDEVVDKKTKKKRHKKLMKDIETLSGATKKRSKKTKRTEPTPEISEHAWTTGQDRTNKVNLSDLVGCLKTDTKKIATMKNQLRTMEKSKQVLEKPLHKPEQQRVERRVAYDETKKDISKWDETVRKNRDAETLNFPLQSYQAPKQTISTISTNFKPQNDLEREIAEVLKGSQHLLERKDKELTEHEEEALKNFDLQEALERRKELQKMRALQSYYEAKCRRQKKIKSKKYHRILKKEKQKALSNVDLEKLSKDDPEMFEKHLEKAEKMRAMERASLRHRNSSKWAKNVITKGKQNKEDQERIREQLRISRELTNHKTVSDSEDENDIEEGMDTQTPDQQETTLKLLTATSTEEGGSSNPWLLGGRSNSQGQDGEEMTEEDMLLKRPKAIVTDESKQLKVLTGADDLEDERSSGEEWDIKEESSTVEEKKAKKKKKKVPKKEKQPADIITQIKNSVYLKETESTTEYKNDSSSKVTEAKKWNKQQHQKKQQTATMESDGIRFLKSDSDAVTIGSFTGNENNSESDSDEDDVINEQRMNIRDAFANDDVIEDFVQEKEAEIEKTKPKAVDNVLPGWGDWGGAGLKVNTRKRKRFTKDPTKEKSRLDDGKANVIINEARNRKFAKHQVSDVPFPYTNRTEFERSIRQPIGEHWNTPSSYEKLIQPRITTNSGTMIDPLKATKKIRKKNKTIKN